MGLPAPAATHVVLDACVLMSGIVRRLLLRLAETGAFRPVWSQRIGDEWRRNAARIWQIDPQWLDTEWAEMQRRFPLADCGDARAFEQGLQYSDAKDWHVIAAARAAQQQAGATVVILTWNLKDFNRSELRRLGLRVLDPDRFLSERWAHDAAALARACETIATDAAALGGTPQPLPDALRRERLFRLQALAAPA